MPSVEGAPWALSAGFHVGENVIDRVLEKVPKRVIYSRKKVSSKTGPWGDGEGGRALVPRPPGCPGFCLQGQPLGLTAFPRGVGPPALSCLSPRESHSCPRPSASLLNGLMERAF